MSIFAKKAKPMLLTGVFVDTIGDDKKLVIMHLRDTNKKEVTIGMPPELAADVLENLSTVTIGLVKKNKEAQDLMYR